MPASRIPIIDVSPLSSRTVEGVARVAAEIGAACRDIGFFYVAGHPVPSLLMSRAFAVADGFFEQPEP